MHALYWSSALTHRKLRDTSRNPHRALGWVWRKGKGPCRVKSRRCSLHFQLRPTWRGSASHTVIFFTINGPFLPEFYLNRYYEYHTKIHCVLMLARSDRTVVVTAKFATALVEVHGRSHTFTWFSYLVFLGWHSGTHFLFVNTNL